MGLKNGDNLEKFLHPDVQFIGPMAVVNGKAAVLEAAKKLIALIEGVTIRAKFGSEDGAMLAYDMIFPAPIGLLRSATLFTFQDGLISKLELFYDSAVMVKKREEIFS